MWNSYGTEEKVASDMVQWVKVLAVKAWQPGFNPKNWHKSGMRGLIP